jgi:Tfp pilus assembly protein PilF
VRLALLPFAADREAADIARRALRQTHGELQGLKSGGRTRFSVTPFENTAQAADATHLLNGSVQSRNGKVLVRAWLADARSRTKVREWTGEYAVEEVRHLPTALAGMVTGAFHLPPLEERAAVSAQARQDYLAGLEYLRRNSTVDAGLPLLERAVAADSASPLTHAALAEGYWWKFQLTRDRKWVERSASALRQAERRNPDLAEVHNIAGLLHSYEGRFEQAEAAYLRSIEIRPRNGGAYRRLGMAYLERNDDPKALAALRRAVELEPDYYRNYQALGDYFKRRADYREAVRLFAKAVELAPNEPATHFALGVAHSWTGNHAEAVKATEAALLLGETPAALNNMGAFLAQQGRDQEAVMYFKRALEWWPERYLLWVNLGTVYGRLHLVTDAERAFRRAVELAEKEMGKNPRGGFARAYLAYACARLGDRRRAASEIAQALQLTPNDADVRQIAVRTYEALGQREESLAVLAVSIPAFKRCWRKASGDRRSKETISC